MTHKDEQFVQRGNNVTFNQFSYHKVCGNHLATHPIIIGLVTTSRSRPLANSNNYIPSLQLNTKYNFKIRKISRCKKKKIVYLYPNGLWCQGNFVNKKKIQ